MTFARQFIAQNLFACLLVGFCIEAADVGVGAQNSDILSKRPIVMRTFDRDTNESTISALLVDPQSDEYRGMWVYSSDRPPPSVRFHSVEYKYSGSAPTRPQTVAFVFVPLEKYKSAPNFSITADSAVLQEGDTSLRELCCVKINGSSANPQHIVVTVPMETFDRITRADKVEFKLTSKRGKYSFKLNDYKRQCLLALVNTME